MGRFLFGFLFSPFLPIYYLPPNRPSSILTPKNKYPTPFVNLIRPYSLRASIALIFMMASLPRKCAKCMYRFPLSSAYRFEIALFWFMGAAKTIKIPRPRHRSHLPEEIRFCTRPKFSHSCGYFATFSPVLLLLRTSFVFRSAKSLKSSLIPQILTWIADL